MKKLMIAAAAAAMIGGAYADCGLEPEEQADCAQVWDVKMSLKSTVCKTLYVGAKKADKCGMGGSEAACYCYREVASVAVKGVLGACDCECETILNLTDDDQYFWVEKNKVQLADKLAIDHLYRIGKKMEKVEFAAWFGALRLAGTGTYDTKNNVVKSVSGNVAGLWTAVFDCTGDCETVCPAFDLCDPDWESGLEVPTVAYGSFTIKYNSSFAKKFAQGKKDLVSDKVAKWIIAEYYCE